MPVICLLLMLLFLLLLLLLLLFFFFLLLWYRLQCCPVCRAPLRLPAGAAASGRQAQGSDRQLLAHLPVSAEPAGASRAVATVRCVKTPGLQRPERSRRLCRAVACAPQHPGERQQPGCEGRRRFAHALLVVAAGACPLLYPVPYTRVSPLSPQGAKTATTVSASPGVEIHIHKSFCKSRQKLSVYPDSRFRPWQ